MPSREITIVGAGLSGPLLAVFLARRGCTVNIHERQGDPRRERVVGGRSINLTIAARGLDALRRVGLRDQVRDRLCKRLHCRVVHNMGGTVNIPYGVGEDEVLYAVSRTQLTKHLLDVAEREPGVQVHFHHKCVDVDKATATAAFVHTGTGRRCVVDADIVVGADGVRSIVRHHMQRGELVDFCQHFVPWRYKELTIDAGGGDLGLQSNGLHVWPRGDFMMFALPNHDRGFNGVCVLPVEGPNSFEEMNSPAAVRGLFHENFPDVVPHMPSLEQEFLGRPDGGFPTIRTSSWHHRDKVVLIGDACHGVIPFYGQGMNAAFEDCVVLDECVAEHWHDWEAAFGAYERRRRVNTDVLADLSIANFSELRHTVARPSTAARKKVFRLAHRVLGERAAPLYSLVSHTTTPYAECVEIARRRERLARLMGADIAVGALLASQSVKHAVRSSLRRAAAKTLDDVTAGSLLAAGTAVPADGSLLGAGTLTPADGSLLAAQTVAGVEASLLAAQAEVPALEKPAVEAILPATSGEAQRALGEVA